MLSLALVSGGGGTFLFFSALWYRVVQIISPSSPVPRVNWWDLVPNMRELGRSRRPSMMYNIFPFGGNEYRELHRTFLICFSSYRFLLSKGDSMVNT